MSGELDPELQDQFEVHLLECPQCQSTVRNLASLRLVLAEQQEEIRQASSQPRRRLAWAWAFAACLVIAGMVASYLVRSRHHQNEIKMATQPAPVPPNNSKTPATVTAATEIQKSRTSKAEHEQQARAAEPSQPEVPAVPNPPPQKDRQVSTVAKAGHIPAKSSEPISEETAVELYKVGLVEPPAYTFAGFGARATPGHNQTQANAAVSPGLSTSEGRALFQQGMAAYVQGHYEDAGASLENAIRVEPDSTEVNFYLGICRIMNGHAAEAVLPLKRVLAGPPSLLTQSAHFYLSKAYVQMKKLDDADEEMHAAAIMPGRLSSAAQALVPRIQALRQALAGQKKQVQSPD